MAQTVPILTAVERIAHYREVAVQFWQWAENEANQEARADLSDMARQYDRLAVELGVRRTPKRG